MHIARLKYKYHLNTFIENVNLCVDVHLFDSLFKPRHASYRLRDMEFTYARIGLLQPERWSADGEIA